MQHTQAYAGLIYEKNQYFRNSMYAAFFNTGL